MARMNEPAWLAAKIDQRVAFLRTHGVGPEVDADFVMTPLTEPEGEGGAAMDRWERTCDNCGAYCPDPIPFWTGSAARDIGTVQVIIMFGTCKGCKDL